MAHEMFIDHMACDIESRVPKQYSMLEIFGMALVYLLQKTKIITYRYHLLMTSHNMELQNPAILLDNSNASVFHRMR